MTTTRAAETIDFDALRPPGGGAALFEGADHGGAAVSFFVANSRPGGGVGLHRHPYDEIFVVLEGEATFRVGGDTVLARGGQVVVAPANLPHEFRNTGSGPLRMVNVNASDRVTTEWLPDDGA